MIINRRIVLRTQITEGFKSPLPSTTYRRAAAWYLITSSAYVAGSAPILFRSANNSLQKAASRRCRRRRSASDQQSAVIDTHPTRRSFVSLVSYPQITQTRAARMAFFSAAAAEICHHAASALLLCNQSAHRLCCVRSERFAICCMLAPPLTDCGGTYRTLVRFVVCRGYHDAPDLAICMFRANRSR